MLKVAGLELGRRGAGRVAGFFHVSQSRDADRRLAVAGAGPGAVVASRLFSTLALATVASAAALVALAVRTDVAGTGRVIGATALSAVIYAGFGVLVGALVRSELNGSLIVMFAWIEPRSGCRRPRG